MADLNQALFRIDPTEGLLQYVQTIKPYHSKVLDVFVEYIYSEPCSISMKERLQLEVGLQEFTTPVVYTCGYGYVWSPFDPLAPDFPTGTVVSATGEFSVVATPTVSSSTLTLTPDITNYIFPVGAPVTFLTSGAFPSASVPIAQGRTYYVLTSTLTTLTVSATVGGTPIIFTTAGTGTLRVRQTNLPYNSFLVSMAAAPQHDVVVSNLTTNQLVVATPFNVASVTPSLNRWRVTGDMTIAPYNAAPGDTIYVRSNTDPSSNVAHTIASVSFAAGQTTIIVNESVSLTATATGTVNLPVAADDAPYIQPGTAVKLASTGTFPVPTSGTGTYYFHPSSTPGVFNLASVRYPVRADQIVNLTALNTGQLRMFRAEPFTPGMYVGVTGSFNAENDRSYIINSITPEGSNFRIHVLDAVQQTTPVGTTPDGTMAFLGDYGSPYCAPASTPDLFIASYFSEDIDFQFGPMPVQPYLYDTFSGTGTLSGYTCDSGHQWNIIQMVDSLTELVRNGDGQLVTSDTDIWASSNWAIPGGTYYVEAELYVKEKPVSSSPYFRLFVKEAGVNFFGPYVDIRPDASGNIFVDARDGNLANAGLVVDTGIAVNRMIKVRLRVISNNQLQVLVNGVVVYTSGVIAWPTLTQAGFNFTVPAGDASQFLLNKVLGNT